MIVHSPKWPKTPPSLTPAQEEAREKFMKLWHEILPNKFGIVEKFNHGFVARLPLKEGGKTLEIGAGLGEHSKFEDLTKQDYHSLEYREEFCTQLRKISSSDHVWCADIQKRQDHWKDGTFNRIVAIHVLEHLPNLPLALREISRLLTDDGVFDVVIPCEGGMAYSLARKISAERVFRKNFKMDYQPIVRSEHVNTYFDVVEALDELFTSEKCRFFPLVLPIMTVNLIVGFRMVKKKLVNQVQS